MTVRRWLGWIGLGAVVAALAVVVWTGTTGQPSTSPRDAERVASYRARLRPLLEQGGSVVALGLQPGVGDIRDQRFGHDVLDGMADAWIHDLRDVRADVEAVDHPEFLADTHRLYLAALDSYVAAATTLRLAATAPAEIRPSLLTKAASLGRRADRTYDEADRSLEAAVKRLEHQGER